MASFQIRADSAERQRARGPKVFQEAAARAHQGKRAAFQPVNSKIVRQETKRAKLACKENAEPVVKVETGKNDSKVEAGKNDSKVEAKRNDEKEVQKPEVHSDCINLVKNDGREMIVTPKQTTECVVDLEPHAEYLRDIWSYLINMEKSVKWPNPKYMSKQVNLDNNMRCILVDWLVSVAEEYKMSEQTLHLSVNYIDRFLTQMSVVKGKFQLLGAAAMMVAGKVEDIYPPDSKEWAYLTGSCYTPRQVQRMEQLLLKVLQFNLQPPTMLTFVQQICVEHKLDKETMYLAMYISELILLEGDDYLEYLPSKLAAACIALARFTLSKQTWPRNLRNSSGYTLKQLSPVVQRQNRTFLDSPTKPHQAIQNKYQTAKYCKVALLKPKILKLDDSDSE